MPAMDVVGIELVPVEHELTMPFAIAGGGMDTARAVIVRVELANGTIGLGEAAPFPTVSGETLASTMAALERHRGPDALRDAPAAGCALE
jgi:L-alanine-DL-glutamate epimerase-like enolase superfamily enzyme